MIHHFYHVYADGAWRRPWLEHRAALERLPHRVDEVVVGIVGNDENRAEARNYFDPSWTVVEAATGWEQVTLQVLHEMAEALTGPVLYAHTKGAANPSQTSDWWRRCMSRKVVSRRGLDALETGHDTVGCHWLTPELNPVLVQIPYYGGNFWWATPEHLRQLPAPSQETRYHAEAWLGTVRPTNPADLAPGWPGASCANH